MQSVLAIFVLPILILNLLGGIVGGVWLAAAGHWSLVLGGIAIGMVSPFILSVAVLPGMLFVVPGTAALEHNKFFLGTLLGILSFAWVVIFISCWCVGTFIVVLPHQIGGYELPYLLWGYSIATGPWTYMASRESQADASSTAPITAFFTCLGAAAVIVGVVVTGNTNPNLLIWCFSGPMVLCFLFTLSAFLMSVRHQKHQYTTLTIQKSRFSPSEGKRAGSTEGEPDKSPRQEASWYIFVQEKQVGPATYDDLKRLVQRGLLIPEMLVWCPDQKQWMKAQLIRGLFSQGSADNESINIDKKPATRDEKRRNYFVRHWRGELSLPISYWVNCVLGNIPLLVVLALIAGITELKDEFDPTIALLAALGTWVVIAVVGLWQTVGTWRAATSYRLSHPSKYWGGITKCFLFVGILQLAAALANTGIPQIHEYYKIYAGDEDVGKYAFKVLRDGRELEFSGGITFGAAKALDSFVNAMGALQLVHLDSPGGRVSEALRIADIIKRRGLSTYVSNRCLSACTLIFLSGRERLISADGKLGFHQPDFPGMTDEERKAAIATQETILEESGVSETFARRANMARPNDMWFPTTAELLSDKVATRVVDSSDYAISGWGQEEVTAAKVEQMLDSYDVYVAIKKHDSQAYNVIAQRVTEALREGRSPNEIAEVLMPLVDHEVAKFLPYSREEVLRSFVQLREKQLILLEKADPSQCYYMLRPEEADEITLRSIRNSQPELTEQEVKLKSDIINSSSVDVEIPDEKKIKPVSDMLFGRLMMRSDFDPKLFGAKSVARNDYGRYCVDFIAFYDEILKLRPTDGVRFLRNMYLSN